MRIAPHTLKILDTFALRTKRSFYGMRQGAHRSQRRGHGVEFAEYRQYEVGDNPRAIDWNLYGRSDKLYVKRYLEEENVSLYIIIDGSRSLTHTEVRAKWELATHIAANASYIGLATQDPVTISILGGPHGPTVWGARALSTVTSFLTSATNSLVSDEHHDIDVVEAARRAATRVRFPGICLVISDFLFPIDKVAALLASFRARNMEIHAVQVLGAHDTSPSPTRDGATVVDSETGEERGVSLDHSSRELYADLLARHTRAVREHCLSNQITYSLATLRDDSLPEQIALDVVTRMGLFV